MKIVEQFEKYANSYNRYNYVQAKGAKILAKHIEFDTKNIADIGCGSGLVYNNIKNICLNLENFYAVDYSKNMLEIHPSSKEIKKVFADFNDNSFYEELKDKNLDLIVSSSSLQWANDLKNCFKNLSTCANKGVFFLFEANTFKTLHNTIGVNSPIYTFEEIKDAFCDSYEPIKIEKYSFKLEFSSTLEMLRYITKSGVSGGLNVGYKNIKKILSSYPYNYLEFETVLLKGNSK